jgi:hypothetical protein
MFGVQRRNSQPGYNLHERVTIMRAELRPVDITAVHDLPDLVRLVEEVGVTGMPRRITRGSEEIAVLVPAVSRRRRRRTRDYTDADWKAFRASAGSWKDVDTDTLIADIYESRRSSRPPVDL